MQRWRVALGRQFLVKWQDPELRTMTENCDETDDPFRQLNMQLVQPEETLRQQS